MSKRAARRCTDVKALCAIQAACSLDVKGDYMVHRLHLRRVYNADPRIPRTADVASDVAAATQLGFVVVDTCAPNIAGVHYITTMLDFGPAS